jgi:hypothetical protein
MEVRHFTSLASVRDLTLLPIRTPGEKLDQRPEPRCQPLANMAISIAASAPNKTNQPRNRVIPRPGVRPLAGWEGWSGWLLQP